MNERGGHDAKWDNPDREKHTVWYYFHVSLKWNELTGNRDENDGCQHLGIGVRKLDRGDKKILTFSYKMNNIWGPNV